MAESAVRLELRFRGIWALHLARCVLRLPLLPRWARRPVVCGALRFCRLQTRMPGGRWETTGHVTLERGGLDG